MFLLRPNAGRRGALTLGRPSCSSSPPKLLNLISIPPKTNIYTFGAPSRSLSPLVRFEQLGWAFEPRQTWAVVSDSTGGLGKGAIFKTLLGHTRVEPDSHDAKLDWVARGGLYPSLSLPTSPRPSPSPSSDTDTPLGPHQPLDPYSQIGHVAFRQRSGIGGELVAEGSFFDYTARYGALRDKEDRVTLREALVSDATAPSSSSVLLLERLITRMGLEDLLDIPLLTLSNGQTRRARIVKAILRQPRLLLLDEPLTGLDASSRRILNLTLQELHEEERGTGTHTMNFVIGIRKGEAVPDWISNVLEIRDGVAIPQSRDEFVAAAAARFAHLPSSYSTTTAPAGFASDSGSTTTTIQEQQVPLRPLVVDIQNGNVAYGDRKILRNINWQIRQGERWHLQGSNGSGKTTLLALITGDHPQSFVQPHLYLPSPSSPCPSTTPTPTNPPLRILPRKRIPTAHLRRSIGIVSPEMFDAFPRRHPGMSVWEAVTTGFDGGFVPRTKGAPRGSVGKGAMGGGKGGAGWVDVGDEEVGVDGSVREMEVERERMREWRVERCWEVLEQLGPAAWTRLQPQPQPQPPRTLSTPTPSPSHPSPLTIEFASRSFTSLSPGEQRLVLLMRALVAKPPLVLLDEAWSGMDERMLRAAKDYLRAGEGGVDEEQAVVVVTHWEDEVPWSEGERVRKFRL